MDDQDPLSDLLLPTGDDDHSVDSIVECRVCRGPSSDNDPLYSPCKCRGSIKWVHQSCLQDWLRHRGRSDALCELCKHSFTFAPIYAPDAPATIPTQQIIGDLCCRLMQFLPVMMRFLLVTNAWVILVPLLTRAMLRACIRAEFNWMLSPRQFLVILPDSPVAFMNDFQSGVLLCSVIFVTFAVILVLRELIPTERHRLQPEPVETDALVPADVAPDPHAAPDPHVPPEANFDGDPFVFIDDMPLSQWLGFSGHLTIFVTHFCSVLLCNFLVLIVTVFIPLRVGRFFLQHIFRDTPSSLISRSLDAADSVYRALTAQEFVSKSARNWVEESLSVSSDLEDCATIAVGAVYIISAIAFGLIAASTWGNTWMASFARSLQAAIYQIAICLKVAWFLTVELVFCPIVFGVAIDALTLDIRQTSLDVRYAAFFSSPVLSTLLYWIAGIALFLKLSLFASTLRQILRRDIYLMLFRDPEDPDFHPIQELINRPVPRLVRNLIASVIAYMILLVLFLHIPSRMALKSIPTLAPLNLRFSDATDRMPADLVFLHFCLPFAVERIQMGRWHVRMLEIWFVSACRLLSLSDVLLPSASTQRTPNPPHMALRVFALLLLGWISYLISACILVIMPLLIGRVILSAVTYHDIYAYLVGCNFFLVICWAIEQTFCVVLRRDLGRFAGFCGKWAKFGAKCLCICLGGGIILPLLIGMLFDLVVIVPLRVPVNESAIIFLAQDWTMGLVALKIWSRLLNIGLIPSVHWRQKIERLEQMGVHGLDVRFVLAEIVWPLIFTVGAHLAIPYTVSRGIYPLFDSNIRNQEAVFRSSFAVLVILRLILFSFRLLSQWYADFQKAVFNDRYLVGQRLINHE